MRTSGLRLNSWDFTTLSAYARYLDEQLEEVPLCVKGRSMRVSWPYSSANGAYSVCDMKTPANLRKKVNIAGPS
ncbi:hypothetical protein CKAN_01298600 [Cinnamomum micranthum f. kanehirae]|uniref:Uncharacterized protein n=1 Tax=Cinnamomum micranthum f. kanehirae TaxID=337451 RepID=A0A3S4P0R2_9MAGN|nr:hypothetical protein CKAN_01298600 [Cinnamomum micranthum f. kanehirae]